jgi:hypothetical protein
MHFLMWLSGIHKHCLIGPKKLCNGGRPQWMPKIEHLMEILEEILVDVSRLATNGGEVLHKDKVETLTRWTSSLWPYGVTRCATALENARHDLARNVSARLVVEALVSRFQAEIRLV